MLVLLFLFISPAQSNYDVDGRILHNIRDQSTCEPISIPECNDALYNRTRMPNAIGHTTQEEVRQAISMFKPLMNSQKSNICSEHARFFLCSAFVPMCSENLEYPISACRSVCLKVKSDCGTVLQQFGFEWPELLNCDEFPADNSEKVCMSPFASRERQRPIDRSHYDHDRYSNDYDGFGTAPRQRTPAMDICDADFIPLMDQDQSRGDICAPSCSSALRFPASARDFTYYWLLIWSVVCILITAAVLLSARDRSRFVHPERPILYLTGCSLVYALGCIGSLVYQKAAGQAAACTTDDRGCSYLIQSELESTPPACVVIFLILYYVRIAACAWFAILSLCWFLAAGPKWSPEAIRAYEIYFHFTAWTIPAFLAIAVLLLRKIDGDALSGLCGVGNSDSSTLLYFVIAPYACFHAVGLVFLVAGFIGLCSVRRDGVFKAAHELGRFDKLMLRVGAFALFYIVSATTLLACYVYQYVDLENNWPPGTCVVRERLPRAHTEIYVLAHFMTLASGITTVVWIISPKTLRSTWCCCLYQNDSKNTSCPSTGETALVERYHVQHNMRNPEFVNMQQHYQCENLLPKMPPSCPPQRHMYAHAYSSAADSHHYLNYCVPSSQPDVFGGRPPTLVSSSQDGAYATGIHI